MKKKEKLKSLVLREYYSVGKFKGAKPFNKCKKRFEKAFNYLS